MIYIYIYLYVGKISRYYLIPKFFPKFFILVISKRILERFFFLFCSRGGGGFQASQVARQRPANLNTYVELSCFSIRLNFFSLFCRSNFRWNSFRSPFCGPLAFLVNSCSSSGKRQKIPLPLPCYCPLYLRFLSKTLSKFVETFPRGFEIINADNPETLSIRTSVKLSQPNVSRNKDTGNNFVFRRK